MASKGKSSCSRKNKKKNTRAAAPLKFIEGDLPDYAQQLSYADQALGNVAKKENASKAKFQAASAKV